MPYTRTTLALPGNRVGTVSQVANSASSRPPIFSEKPADTQNRSSYRPDRKNNLTKYVQEIDRSAMEERDMMEIKRTELSEEWAHSGIVEAGGYVFISYCMGNEGQSVENQINGAFDLLEKRLETIGLGLGSVVKMDCLLLQRKVDERQAG